MKRNLILLLTLLISISTLAAPQKKENQRKGKACNREQIECARIAYFTREIDITTEEATAFWAVYNDYCEEKAEARKAVRNTVKELAKMTSEKSRTSDIDYKRTIKAHLDAQKAIHSITEMYYEEFFKILGPEKVARLIIAEEDFRREMIHMLHQKNIREDCPETDKN